ncbi:hypothetical protein SAMN04488128_101914 [Chitinophaga eiseniae]|uniref:Uncharacterized protein n=1 Tax=Chitinophaga eiseniae TaxID=634771 RepID=A0A1T4M2T8_9BACT|nr:hypothetical protein [Chitinophaga eiseniae]SJZ61197.1 hypothetical protein SAMN04488128_101914 [Chitinophaga eiseniae]
MNRSLLRNRSGIVFTTSSITGGGSTIFLRRPWLSKKITISAFSREVYKLTIVNNITIIQGLVSLEVKSDHIYMHLVESAPFNKGKMKVYAGVPGNLVAFVCRVSFRRGFDGTVSFLSKTQLIDHYIESLGAIHIGGQRMIIETKAALKLIDKYFKN